MFDFANDSAGNQLVTRATWEGFDMWGGGVRGWS